MYTINVEKTIENLGGVKEVAKLCDISIQAVYKWIAAGEIPKARLMFIELARPGTIKRTRTKRAA